MQVLQFIGDNHESFSFLASLFLVGITTYYAIITQKILKVTKNQQNIIFNPLIGIGIKEISIGKEWAPKKRALNITLELTNIGNATAIEVCIDSEIELRHGSIKNEKIIPSQLEPYIIPFIKQDETKIDISQNYGNNFIFEFFHDINVRHESIIHRRETNQDTNGKCDKIEASKLYVNVYYRNSIGQYFYSRYEIEIGIVTNIDVRDKRNLIKDPIPAPNESKSISMFDIPQPIFISNLISKKEIKNRIEMNNKKRKLCE